MQLRILNRIPLPANWELSFDHNRVCEIVIDGKYVVEIPTLKQAREDWKRNHE